MEREQSIPRLEQEQTRLSKFVDQRRQLYDVVGTGHIKEGSDITTDIKIGRVKGMVEGSRLRAETHLAQVQEDFNRLVKEQEADLILRASRYIDQVALFRVQLEELQRFSHHLNPATLEKHTQQLRGLESLPETDLELKTGLQLKQQRLEQERHKEPSEPTVEAKPPKILLLDKESQTVIIVGERKVRLAHLEFTLLGHVADPKKTEEQRTSQSLRQLLYHAGSNNDHAVGASAHSIRQKLGQEVFKKERQGQTFIWSIDEGFEAKAVIHPAEPEQPPLPIISYRAKEKLIQIKGGLSVQLTPLQAAAFEPLYHQPGEIVPSTELSKLLKEVGIPFGKRPNHYLREIEGKLGTNLFEFSGHGQDASCRLQAVIEQPLQEEKKRKRYQESRQLFEITLDGRQIKVMGRLTAISLQTLADTSLHNKMRLAELAKHLYGNDDQTAMGNARGLMYINNKGPFAKLNLQVVIDGIKDQATVYLKRLVQPDIEKLQGELEELQTRRLSIAEKVSAGILDRRWLEEIDQEISRIELELKFKTLKPEDLEGEEVGEHFPPEGTPDFTKEEPGRGTMIKELPYVPTEEEKRSFRETALLSFIITTIQTSRPLLFEEMQAAMVPESRKRKGIQIDILQGGELKKVFHSALRKIREEAELAHLRETWTENDMMLWEQLKSLIQGMSGGDVENFISRVERMIYASERRFYRDQPPESGKVYRLTL